MQTALEILLTAVVLPVFVALMRRFGRDDWSREYGRRK